MAAKKEGFPSEVILAIAQHPDIRNLTIIDSGFSDANFGNSYVEFAAAAHFKVRFVCDRGDVFFQVADSAAHTWWPGEALCVLFDCDLPKLDLKSNIHAFHKLWPYLGVSFQADHYKAFSTDIEKIISERAPSNK